VHVVSVKNKVGEKPRFSKVFASPPPRSLQQKGAKRHAVPKSSGYPCHLPQPKKIQYKELESL
jgi:hypothetical protein